MMHIDALGGDGKSAVLAVRLALAALGLEVHRLVPLLDDLSASASAHHVAHLAAQRVLLRGRSSEKVWKTLRHSQTAW